MMAEQTPNCHVIRTTWRRHDADKCPRACQPEGALSDQFAVTRHRLQDEFSQTGTGLVVDMGE